MERRCFVAAGELRLPLNVSCLGARNLRGRVIGVRLRPWAPRVVGSVGVPGTGAELDAGSGGGLAGPAHRAPRGHGLGVSNLGGIAPGRGTLRAQAKDLSWIRRQEEPGAIRHGDELGHLLSRSLGDEDSPRWLLHHFEDLAAAAGTDEKGLAPQILGGARGRAQRNVVGCVG